MGKPRVALLGRDSADSGRNVWSELGRHRGTVRHGGRYSLHHPQRYESRPLFCPRVSFEARYPYIGLLHCGAWGGLLAGNAPQWRTVVRHHFVAAGGRGSPDR